MILKKTVSSGNNFEIELPDTLTPATVFIGFSVLACTALLVSGWLISQRHRHLVRDAQEGRR